MFNEDSYTDIERKECLKFLPNLSIPKELLLVPTPSFNRAYFRMLLTLNREGCQNYRISVYLDGKNELGYGSKKNYSPGDELTAEHFYWEIYPTEDEDTERFRLYEADKMFKRIIELLEYHNRNNRRNNA